MSRLAQWKKLPVSLAELCIDTTLCCGQSFRWRKFDDEWRSTLHGRIIFVKQDSECVHYKTIFPSTEQTSLNVSSRKIDVQASESEDDTEALLRSYFNLQLNLGALYAQWCSDDANFRKKAPSFSGIRILNQDAWEALLCFICSSNNNISRISQMAHKLCLHYGVFLGTVDGEAYHDFPTPDALAGPGIEGHLRQLGFGYRAKYIAQTAKALCQDKPPGWLSRLRNPLCPSWPSSQESEKVLDDKVAVVTEEDDGEPETPTYKHAHEQLLTLSGVGPKVSDCVCLMGLGWGEAVPVDTHVWQIAVRDYKFKKQAGKTFSKGMHDAVGDHFRRLWGQYAGWAQSVLFTANLRAFSDRLTSGGEAIMALKQEETAVKMEPVEQGSATVMHSKKRKLEKELGQEEDADGDRKRARPRRRRP